MKAITTANATYNDTTSQGKANNPSIHAANNPPAVPKVILLPLSLNCNDKAMIRNTILIIPLKANLLLVSLKV